MAQKYLDKLSETVVVIGAGTMGRGIAAGFVARGYRVTLLLRDAGRGAAASNDVLALARSIASSHTPDAPDAPGALTVSTLDAMEPPPAWRSASLVIETVSEDLGVKQALFAWLDPRVPDGVPIGSNSSSHPISRIAAGLPTRARMFGMHYFMPAHLVPLVEVVLGQDSSPALAEQVCAMFAAAGKKPVLVKRDIAGFLANRIQHALMREVLSLIDSGIASPEDIDTAVRYSFGFRYAAIGPILQKEISGWESTAAAAREIFPTLSNTAELPQCVERLLAEGKLGMKSGAGFVTWTPEAAEATRAAYTERLGAALRLLE
jgi:3-hydroxybutyryl-CoA dehydrogenase